MRELKPIDIIAQFKCPNPDCDNVFEPLDGKRWRFTEVGILELQCKCGVIVVGRLKLDCTSVHVPEGVRL